MPDLYYLSDADRLTLQRLISKVNRLKLPNRSYELQQPDPQTPRFFVALTPGSGIPALIPDAFGNTGTGTPSGTGSVYFDRPGHAECSVWRALVQVGGYFDLTPLPTPTIEVLNLSTSRIPGNTWILIQQDRFGQWYAIQPGGGAGGGDGSDDNDVDIYSFAAVN